MSKTERKFEQYTFIRNGVFGFFIHSYVTGMWDEYFYTCRARIPLSGSGTGERNLIKKLLIEHGYPPLYAQVEHVYEKLDLTSNFVIMPDDLDVLIQGNKA